MLATRTSTDYSQKSMLKIIAESIFGFESKLASAWAAWAHKRLYYSQWGIAPTPQWFDHAIDQYYNLHRAKNSFWLERGIFGSLALKGGRLLELSCGDGFNARHFYAHRSREVIACDFDRMAIATAMKKNQADNIKYVLADIRYEMPEGKFENVVWDEAIAYFTPDEIVSVLRSIKSRLTDDGILSGSTVVEKEDGGKHIHHHEYEFKDLSDLKIVLTPHFWHVKVFETIHPNRHNLYFWASDACVPFGEGWAHAV